MFVLNLIFVSSLPAVSILARGWGILIFIIPGGWELQGRSKVNYKSRGCCPGGGMVTTRIDRCIIPQFEKIQKDFE